MLSALFFLITLFWRGHENRAASKNRIRSYHRHLPAVLMSWMRRFSVRFVFSHKPLVLLTVSHFLASFRGQVESRVPSARLESSCRSRDILRFFQLLTPRSCCSHPSPLPSPPSNACSDESFALQSSCSVSTAIVTMIFMLYWCCVASAFGELNTVVVFERIFIFE